MKRRTWLLGAAGASGALVVGWGALPQRSRLGSTASMLPTDGDVALNGWIKVGLDGTVVLAMPRCEMGQGVHTALSMLAAEELDVPLERVKLEQASADTLYGNVAFTVDSLPFHPLERENDPVDGFSRVKFSRWIVGKTAREVGINATGGSSTIADLWEPVRLAAATARASLMGAASLQWRLPVDELTLVDGVVSHAASSKSAPIGDFARFASATPAGEVRLKPRKEWKQIGRAAPRVDVPAKVDGRARFGIDTRLAGLKFASTRLSPIVGGAPGRIDATRAMAMPGAERLVMLPAYRGAPAGFAVIGRTTWHAARAAAAVEVEWRGPAGKAVDTARIEAELVHAAETGDGFVFYERGSVRDSHGANRIDAVYKAPYLAHATMEPMNCTVLVSGGRVKLWVPTQVPQLCAEAAALVAGIPVANVEVHATLLGGGFGRRLEVDYAAIATRVAMDAGGAPVQVVWPREEDMTHDYYRPLHAARLAGTLDGSGALLSLEIRSAGDGITPRWLDRVLPSGMKTLLSGLQLTAPTLPGVSTQSGPLDLADKTSAEGLFDLPYGIPNQKMSHVSTRSGVPVGFWRSVGHSHNAFFSESFIDELAVQAKQDPVAFRRGMLKEAPRYLAVLNLAAEKAGWGKPLAAGRARGVALHESFGSIVAQVAEVSLDAGKPKVHRVTCAADCGTVVNPGIVAQQMEGAVVYGLTAALYGRIDIREGVVQQRTFAGYPMLRLAQAPVVETWLIASERPPQGVGEPGVPPIAPAVANALFALTGQRHRSLPLAA